MSHLATQWWLTRAPHAPLEKGPRHGKWFNVDFLDLVQPDSYWPHALSIEQAFETFRWMVGSAESVYGHAGPIELLSTHPTCINFGTVSPIVSIADLRARFHWGILARANKSQIKWRETNGIQIGLTGRITVPHYKPFLGSPIAGRSASERDIQRALATYFSEFANRQLNVELNRVHHNARTIASCDVAVEAKSFYFRLNYGYQGSVWHYTLASTRDGESFLDTFDRALQRIVLFTSDMPGVELQTLLNAEDAAPNTERKWPRESWSILKDWPKAVPSLEINYDREPVT